MSFNGFAQNTAQNLVVEFGGQEGVKKSNWLKFPSFWFDAKCMPTPQRSLIGHPGAVFLMPKSW
jgi:hypothetical protein